MLLYEIDALFCFCVYFMLILLPLLHLLFIINSITLNPVTNACKEKHFKTCNAKNNNKTFNKPHAQPQPVHAASFLGVPDQPIDDSSDPAADNSGVNSKNNSRPGSAVSGLRSASNMAGTGVVPIKQRYLHCQILL